MDPCLRRDDREGGEEEAEIVTYTINKLAKISGVTVRTLHYYDQIGLLKPSYISENGYRHYEERELLLLQQILFFRELVFPLDKIKAIIVSPDFNIVDALKDQKRMLELDQKRRGDIINTIQRTIKKLQGEIEMQDEELYGGLTREQQEEYKKEASERWGEGTVKESYRRLNQLTAEQQKVLFNEGVEVTKAIAEAAESGLAPDSDDVQALIQRHYNHINFFYTCTLEIYRGLGEMYVNDPRFTAYYEKFGPGLAQYMQKAMHFYCDQKEKKQ